MGYFSNGSEGSDYEDRYCRKCVHGDGCAVMGAHLMRNYEECNNEDSILHMLIPRSEDGCFNLKCLMFHEKRQYRKKFKTPLLTESTIPATGR